ncbi:MAG: hypothetical protein UU12_C0045G0006 [Candidatus Woesebacteria bacterium GW2011_GWA2_40_7b]|uniref:Uncharacterized protein n=1 Tax=Candidatus Woesebacteria bacterium GW2011_GWA2_40_7b TaxID=1618563 RepID=A0A0G0W2A9_9BACT|nr:MAG: hypothetical protein UU12_C0045G0006 [Candidatus Woesebacteria bacterium GW2011_GWA2_40_7b]
MFSKAYRHSSPRLPSSSLGKIPRDLFPCFVQNCIQHIRKGEFKMKMLIVRKLSAASLIAISICHIFGTYTAVYLLQENYLADLLLRRFLGRDIYTVLSVLIYLGFLTLWAVLIHRNKLNVKFITGLLIFTLFGILWFWFMNSQYATMKGFESAMWVNMISMGINSFFAFAYIISKHD